MNWLPKWANTSGEVIKTSFIAAMTGNGVGYSTTRVSVAMSVESPNWLPLMSRQGTHRLGAPRRSQCLVMEHPSLSRAGTLCGCPPPIRRSTFPRPRAIPGSEPSKDSCNFRLPPTRFPACTISLGICAVPASAWPDLRHRFQALSWDGATRPLPEEPHALPETLGARPVCRSTRWRESISP